MGLTKKEKLALVLLVPFLLLSIAVPVKGLLIHGVYNWHLRQPEFHVMAAEMVLLVLIFCMIWFVIRRTRKQNALALMLTSAICLLFAWCHVIFLPAIVSFGYLLYIILAGRIFRVYILKKQVDYPWFADLLLGSALVITEFCLLSAVKLGSIEHLRIAVLVTGFLLLAAGQKELRNVGKEIGSFADNITLNRLETAALIFMICMVLIQVGRMNISLDFDSLWYGVRSEYMLAGETGIYENPGSVGVVYTYSKGLETLVLPLSGVSSYSFQIFFNIWMSVFTLFGVYETARFYMGKTMSVLAAAMVSSIPAIMNMSITAKTDTMTLTVQVLMICYLLAYLKGKQVIHLFLGAGALLLSWTLKPTSLVFSSAVFGMVFLYLLFTRQFSLRATWRQWLAPGLFAAALTGIWARTLLIVGIPVTSVFSAIFQMFGMELKYPFATLPVYGDGAQGGSVFWYLLESIGKMLLLPVGETMNHVVFAWGTSLIFFFGAVLAVFGLLHVKNTSKRVHAPLKDDPQRNLCICAHTVMIPFLAVCLISLAMLGQIDGNYFMLMYVLVILYGCRAIEQMPHKAGKTILLWLLVPVMALNTVMTMVSNWAWSLGFTPIQIVNRGYYDHVAKQHETMVELGNGYIWDILAQDPSNRVIAEGDHPQVLAFPCNVQSYGDVTSAWGNVWLVSTMERFIDYLDYAETDYIYMQAGKVEENSRCYELMGYLIEAGILTDIFYENGNMLAKVDLNGQYGSEASKAYEEYQVMYQKKQ